MPHQSFGAVRTLAEREPVTFDFGMFDEHRFVVIPEPSLGDTFDLYDAPEPTPETMLDAARVCARFVRRMIVPEQRARFDEALVRIPASHAHLIVDACRYIAEQVIGRPTEPLPSSSDGQRGSGTNSSTTSGGTSTSTASPPDAPTR